MATPKEIDDALLKEFDITEAEDASQQVKVAYVKAQIDEMKKAILRSRIDVILSDNLANSENEQLAQKGAQNRAENRHLVKQFTSSVKVLNKFLSELEK